MLTERVAVFESNFYSRSILQLPPVVWFLSRHYDRACSWEVVHLPFFTVDNFDREFMTNLSILVFVIFNTTPILTFVSLTGKYTLFFNLFLLVPIRVLLSKHQHIIMDILKQCFQQYYPNYLLIFNTFTDIAYLKEMQQGSLLYF